MVGKEGISFGLHQLSTEGRKIVGEKNPSKKLVRNDRQTLADFW